MARIRPGTLATKRLMRACDSLRHAICNAVIDVMLWPAKSPDINLIENIWSSMSRFINGINHIPKIVAELRAAVYMHIVWRRESQARIRRLVASVLGRHRTIVDVQGGHVNYQYTFRELF